MNTGTRLRSYGDGPLKGRNGAANVTSVIFCGRGGQGVLFGSEVLALAAMWEGFDVKKSEVHGMAQRGGSVVSQVRFGKRVFSPLVPRGGADFVVALDEKEGKRYVPYLSERGTLVALREEVREALPDPRTENVALVGVLSREFDFSERSWRRAIAAVAPPGTVERNLESFELGRGGCR